MLTATIRKFHYLDNITKIIREVATTYRGNFELSEEIPVVYILTDVMTALGLSEADIKTVLGDDYAMVDCTQPVKDSTQA